MATGQLLTAGLFCCALAMLVQLFPAAAFSLGADVSASWRLFAFGVFLIGVAARISGAPVKWIEDRRENLVATNHSRQQRHRLRAAVDAEGRLLAIDNVLFHDQGAYVRTHGARVADMSAGLLLGPYVVPAYRATGHFRLTNKTPAATYRSPGRYEGTFVRERLMDAIAARLGIDRIEVRRRNFVPAPDTARAILDDLNPGTGSLLTEMARELRRRSGVAAIQST